MPARWRVRENFFRRIRVHSWKRFSSVDSVEKEQQRWCDVQTFLLAVPIGRWFGRRYSGLIFDSVAEKCTRTRAEKQRHAEGSRKSDEGRDQLGSPLRPFGYPWEGRTEEEKAVKYDLHPGTLHSIRLLFAPPNPPFAYAFRPSGYEYYRISKCDRRKQPANLSVIFHRRSARSLSLFFRNGHLSRGTIARARDITSREPTRKDDLESNLCASTPLLQLIRGELEREHLVPAGVLTATPIKRALRASFALHAANHTQIFCF